ncbi:hypothetical protein QVD17_06827 [Tagetes erecta]|uniref:ADP-ribosyl cyclase/cyclic ADP-ribose hydrolase n=1 Tax=Tagetes erecta TaxID=13708 RepID=A0AAD8LKZ1_TARER|nr:hypothetical protein QVD17_06827 [Tagetes erecta]
MAQRQQKGKDTRYTCVDHLRAALHVPRGICVFKDDEEFKTGKQISPELLKAIEQSRRPGLKAVLVFYHVDPSDTRAQKIDIALFFQQHEELYREEMDNRRNGEKL